MNPALFFSVSWGVFGPLMLEVSGVVGLAIIVHRLLETNRWRRAVWQACALCLLMLAVVEICGFRGLATNAIQSVRMTYHSNWEIATLPAIPEPAEASPKLDLTPAFQEEVARRLTDAKANSELVSTDPTVGSHNSNPLELPSFSSRSSAVGSEAPANLAREIIVNTLVLIWSVGAVLLVLRTTLGRAVVLWLVKRGSRPSEEELQERLTELSARLGTHRPIRLITSKSLGNPIAFGIFKPTIALPSDFLSQFTPLEQEVILLHEIAHLASRDPLWSLIADGAAALLWWHPLAWWQRSRLREASELVADEASSLAPDGPRALASCLVNLGRRFTQQPSLIGLRIEGSGFRSHLGQRVQRLLKGQTAAWIPPGRTRAVLGRFVVPLALTTIALIYPALVHSSSHINNQAMQTSNNPWKSSVAAIAMLAALGNPVISTHGDPPEKPSAPPTIAEEEVPESPTTEDLARKQSQSHQEMLRRRYGRAPATATGGIDPRMAARYGLTAPLLASGIDPGVGATYDPYRAMLKSADSPSAHLQPKLEQIRLKQTEPLEDLPLVEVIRYLDEQARKADPEKEGVNFILSNAPQEQSRPGIDPTTGLPTPTIRSEVPPIEDVPIKLPRLRNVRLNDILDAIIRVAARPLKYTVEDYGVIFSADLSDPTVQSALAPSRHKDAGPLQVRTFAVNTNTLLAGLESAFGIKTGFDSTGRLYPKTLEADRSSSPERPPIRTIQSAFRTLFAELGIIMEVPGKSLFYNPLTGMLMVRATADDLMIVQAAIETLSGTANSASGQAPRRTVTVLGQVAAARVIELPPEEKLTVLEAIAMCGGFTRNAKKSSIEVTRPGGGKPYRFSEDELKQNNEADKAFFLRPGDIIMVDEKVL